MSRYVSYINSSGEEYTFTNILGLSGFDAGDANIISSSSSGQDGAVYISTYLRPRQLEIRFDIQTRTNAALLNRRRTLINMLSSKRGQGRIRYAVQGFDVSIPCAPIRVFCTEHGSTILSVSARFEASNPYFVDSVSTMFSLQFIKNLLVFPVTFPCAFGARTNIGRAQNRGDAPSPVIIRFYGGAENPSFFNHTTNEKIQINGTIPSSSVLEINTAFGIKSVRLITGDQSVNAFSMLDTSSVLWSLIPGINEIEYIATSDNNDTTGEIMYNNMYTGV